MACADGTLQSFNWAGESLWKLPLVGGPPPSISAADLNGDGRAELVVATANQRVGVYSLNVVGQATRFGEYEYAQGYGRYSPLLYDLEQNGRYCLVAPGTSKAGQLAVGDPQRNATPAWATPGTGKDDQLVVRAYRPDGSTLWDIPLGYPSANNGTAVAVNAGNSLPGGKPVVVVHLTNQTRTIDSMIGLDGATGKVLWTESGRRPEGIVNAVDVDGDGLEEFATDSLEWMAFVRGSDGSFALNRKTGPWLPDSPAAAGLYSSFIPLYKTPQADNPHWLVPSGCGRFGMMGPDFTLRWAENVDYDVPGHVGIVDVDGDGVLEAGYALKNSQTFKCRNVWTGRIKWQLELPEPPNSPVLTADVDGDGKGEFLTGKYCIGTDERGQGQVRFQLPVRLTWPDVLAYEYLKCGGTLIADFDGDGLGEIACTSNGRVVILKARRSVDQ